MGFKGGMTQMALDIQPVTLEELRAVGVAPQV
jgi:hypothetical protein